MEIQAIVVERLGRKRRLLRSPFQEPIGKHDHSNDMSVTGGNPSKVNT
jgi:hypothetical protein